MNPYQFYVYATTDAEGHDYFCAMWWLDDRPNAPIGKGRSDYLAIINLLQQEEKAIQDAWKDAT